MMQNNTILGYTVCYFLFFLLLWMGKVKKGIRLMNEDGPVENKTMLVVLHMGGIILFGIIPFIFSDNKPGEIIFGKSQPGSVNIMVVCFLMILVFFVSARLAGKKYTQLNNEGTAYNSANALFVGSYFFIRILFISSYEIWFRGYLLTDCISNTGIAMAIFLNIFFYALLHLPNGKEEVLACFPFGLILCGICVWTAAAWPAILLHLALTLPYENRLIKIINKPSNFIV